MRRNLNNIAADVASGKLTQEQAIEEINRTQGGRGPRQDSRSSRLIVVGVLFLIGLIFALISGGICIYSYSKEQNAERASGEVIKIVRTGGKGGSKPVVRYSVDGREFEIQGVVSSSPPAYSVGEKVTVLYDRNNPADGQIDSFLERWLFPVIFGGVGGLLMVVAFAVWLAMRPRRAADPHDDYVNAPR